MNVPAPASSEPERPRGMAREVHAKKSMTWTRLAVGMFLAGAVAGFFGVVLLPWRARPPRPTPEPIAKTIALQLATEHFAVMQRGSPFYLRELPPVDCALEDLAREEPAARAFDPPIRARWVCWTVLTGARVVSICDIDGCVPR
jgi:hypothetical protein